MRSKSTRSIRRKEKLILNIKAINIGVFLIMISFFSLSSIVMPKKHVSEMEKRELASLPELSVESFFSGDYFKGLEDFYNDTFPFREKFLQLASDINGAKGVRSGEDEIKIYTVK